MSADLRCALGAAGLVALAGCATYLPYELPPNAETVKIRLSTVPKPWICADGKPRALSLDEKGYATIPAGAPVTIGAGYTSGSANVTYSCSPRISFVPLRGETYQQDFDIESERCTARVYREVSTNPVGLDFVRLARGEECRGQ